VIREQRAARYLEVGSEKHSRMHASESKVHVGLFLFWFNVHVERCQLSRSWRSLLEQTLTIRMLVCELQTAPATVVLPCRSPSGVLLNVSFLLCAGDHLRPRRLFRCSLGAHCRNGCYDMRRSIDMMFHIKHPALAMLSRPHLSRSVAVCRWPVWGTALSFTWELPHSAVVAFASISIFGSISSTSP